MEIFRGELGSELVQFNLEAVVFDIVVEFKVICRLGNREVIILDIHLLIVGINNIRHFDAVDSTLNHRPIGLFCLLKHGSVEGHRDPISG